MVRKLKHMYVQILEVANKIDAERSGNKMLTVLDIMFSMLRYGASPNNYYYFGFYKMPVRKRKTYVTHRMSEQIIKKFNHPAYISTFEKKEVFDKVFSDYTKRSFLDLKNYTQESFDIFYETIKENKQVIYKPSETAQGQGIVVIPVKSKDELKNEILSLDKNGVVEQWIQQDERVSMVYPDAVNCLRVITLLNDGKFYVLASNFTFGNHGSSIANASLNNLVCLPDLKTGVIQTDAQDIKGNTYEVHPVSQVKFKGFQIPYWDEVLKICEEAARRIPQVGYIGWDIAISPNGPIIIEGNTTPGYKFFQLASLLPNQTGNKKRYLEGIRGNEE